MNLYVALLRWVATPQNPQIVDVQLTAGVDDWFRYNGNTWLIASRSLSATQVKNIIQRALATDDSVLVIKLDFSDLNGWVPTANVNWLNQYR